MPSVPPTAIVPGREPAIIARTHQFRQRRAAKTSPWWQRMTRKSRQSRAGTDDSHRQPAAKPAKPALRRLEQTPRNASPLRQRTHQNKKRNDGQR